MEPKHLLLTFMPWGFDIIKHPDLTKIAKGIDDEPDGGFVPDDYRRGEDWENYKKVGGRFSVKKNVTIHLHKDNRTILKDYRFSTVQRPYGHRHPHWSKEPLSIDNPRNDLGFYKPGLKSSDMFENPDFKDDSLSFLYTGETATKDSQGYWQDLHFFAYDLYLVKDGSAGFPKDKDFFWIGPVIRNDGSPL